VHEPTDHFIAGKSNDSIWGSSQQVGCTASVKARKTLLLVHLLYTVSDTTIPCSTMMITALFLQFGSYNLPMQVNISSVFKIGEKNRVPSAYCISRKLQQSQPAGREPAVNQANLTKAPFHGAKARWKGPGPVLTG